MCMYHIVTGGNHDNGFRALMIISRLFYIVILKHILQSIHCNDASMHICMIME